MTNATTQSTVNTPEDIQLVLGNCKLVQHYAVEIALDTEPAHEVMRDLDLIAALSAIEQAALAALFAGLRRLRPIQQYIVDTFEIEAQDIEVMDALYALVLRRYALDPTGSGHFALTPKGQEIVGFIRIGDGGI